MSNLYRTDVLIAGQKEGSAVENDPIFYRTAFFLLIVKPRGSLGSVFQRLGRQVKTLKYTPYTRLALDER